MEVNPKQSDITSSEMEWKHLAVNTREIEFMSKALANMVHLTQKVAEDAKTFSPPVRFEMQKMSDDYLKLKSKIDLL